jgi:hypothetical protein
LINRAKPADRAELLFSIVSDYNELHIEPPLPEKEVITIFRSIFRRDNSRKD